MTPKTNNTPQGFTITLQDIYYILFRYKWIIISILTCTIIAAIVVRVTRPILYRSEAELLIKFLSVPTAEINTVDRRVVSLADRDEDIINSEVQILQSMDLAKEIADEVGPQKIIGAGPADTNRLEAAEIIRQNLSAEVPHQSGMIVLSFTHHDPQVVQVVLSSLINAYLTLDGKIHDPAINDSLLGQMETIKGKLADVEANLLEQETKAGIYSIDENRRAASDQIAQIESQIYTATADLAAEEMTVTDLKKGIGTNKLVVEPAAYPPPEIVAEYQDVNADLQAQRSRVMQLMSEYTTNNMQVQVAKQQIRDDEAHRLRLEKEHPGLLAVKSQMGEPSGPDPRVAYNQEILRMHSIGAKLFALTNELASARATAAEVRAAEVPILNLIREKQIYESELTFYQQRRDANQADQAGTGPGNISEVESPTPPTLTDDKTSKTLSMIFVAGFALAFGIPVLIEFYLDQSVKRPADILSRIPVPFFLSIPRLKLDGPGNSRLKSARPQPLIEAPAQSDGDGEALALDGPSEGGGSVAVWDDRHVLRPFYDTLRDRLMTFFEVINLTHKPKLVAVTSCGEGAGVTTTAAGLAASLSETGEGNVLLVNMNSREGEAHHFYRGKLACPLEDVLEKNKRGDAMVHEKLYVAREGQEDTRWPRILPKRFSHLVTKMKASDYDYIIFDMPPVTQISITPRLARFMDMVLLVVEAEKTDREAAARASKILAESKSNVGIVLNKLHDYLPRRFQSNI